MPEGAGTVRVMTPTFIPEEALAMPGYEFVASPSLYSGQTLRRQPAQRRHADDPRPGSPAGSMGAATGRS